MDICCAGSVRVRRLYARSFDIRETVSHFDSFIVFAAAAGVVFHWLAAWLAVVNADAVTVSGAKSFLANRFIRHRISAQVSCVDDQDQSADSGIHHAKTEFLK